jgi:aromatic-L-amino-acid decarboxylase
VSRVDQATASAAALAGFQHAATHPDGTEGAARHPLEPDRGAMEAMGQAAIAFVADFVERLPAAPTFDLDGAAALVAELRRPPGDQPGEFAALLSTFGRAAAKAVDPAVPGYFAYIPGGGLFVSALAEFLARAVNRYTGLAAVAPALIAMEDGVIRWLCGLFGLPASAAGVVLTGGSLATLTAIVAARHDRLGDDFADGTLYVTDQTHHCVAKAARIAGFPAARVRVVPTTPAMRMDVAAAAAMIAADRTAGRCPFMLVGSAGTTNTGAVDPLGELADLARREELWFHVDAAYGGFFQLTERGRARFAGIAAADSIVLDPHKGIFLPYGTGVLLARDGATLRAAFAGQAQYLQDVDRDLGLPEFAGLGPELTRDFRGLRLWLPLHLYGVAAFRAALDEKLDLTEMAYRALVADPRLEVPWPPDLSVVAFRRRGGDEANRCFLERINASRRVFLSSTRVADRFTLRLCILSHRSHIDDVEAAIEIIQGAADD